MKKNIFAIAVVYSSLIFGMKERDHRYYKACREIDERHADEARNRFSKMMNEPIDNLSILRQELEEYEVRIGVLREKAIGNFKKYVKDDVWKVCMHKCDDIQKLNKNISEKSSAFNHIDKNFPKDAYYKIKSELLKQDVFLNRVKLISHEGNFLYGVTARSSQCGNGYLIINKDLWKNTRGDMKDFVCICMAQELTEKLSILVQLVGVFWPGMIKKPKLRNRIESMQNKARVLGMFSACIKNEENASLIKKYALHTTSYVSPKEYGFISAVQWRWDVYNSLIHYYLVERKIAPCIVYRQSYRCGETDED